MNKRFLLTLLLMSIVSMGWAAVPEQDFFHSIGKIYVVFAVILSIFAGIALFLIRMERRINRLENQINPS